MVYNHFHIITAVMEAECAGVITAVMEECAGG